jgi:hypothetical protein
MSKRKSASWLLRSAPPLLCSVGGLPRAISSPSTSSSLCSLLLSTTTWPCLGTVWDVSVMCYISRRRETEADRMER